MDKKLITFVVPCYNSQDYMSNCIDSLLAGGDSVEILIVNDGSTDGTGEIADKYAKSFPDIVRVLDQENGGHGEGINHGLREAKGTYFKVVDSDDWLDRDALRIVLEHLDRCEAAGGVDLCVCNYVYDHRDARQNQTIRYENAFPEGEIFGWEDTKLFKPWQYLTMHSCIHRTAVLRACKVELPKHTFYEDNLFVYLPLPYVKTMYYLDLDLYHYLIGREDQSVSEEILKKRCKDQILVSERIFQAYRLDEIRKISPKLAQYCYHEIAFMVTIATAFTRLNRTKEADKMVDEMWKDLEAFDLRLAKKVKHASMAAVMNLPGRIGRQFGLGCYRLSHKFIAFN